METEVVCTDGFGGEAYRSLFDEIMADIGKAAIIERAKLVLKPEIPLFIFSVVLRAEPVSKTIGDVANVREESDGVHITISNENYAPDVLIQLWKRYGRGAVRQQTRFDMDIENARVGDVESMIIASGEEFVKEVVGAVWRAMPEGIKNRHTLIDNTTITVIATEEKFTPEMLEEGEAVHKGMGETDV